MEGRPPPRQIVIRPERRTGSDRRQAEAEAPADRRQGDRRTMCWEVENCDLAIRYRCPAFILRRPCWELWAVEGLGPARACCHNDTDCEPGRCAIAEKRFAATAPRPPPPSRWPSTSGAAARRWGSPGRGATAARTSS